MAASGFSLSGSSRVWVALSVQNLVTYRRTSTPPLRTGGVVRFSICRWSELPYNRDLYAVCTMYGSYFLARFPFSFGLLAVVRGFAPGVLFGMLILGTAGAAAAPAFFFLAMSRGCFSLDS